MKNWRAIVAVTFLFAAVPSVQTQIRELVGVVQPVYHERTREGFSRLADYCRRHGELQWESFFRWHAGELGAMGHGSGWVYVTPEGRPFLITSRHVVRQAETARVRFEDIEGQTRVFDSVPISYVDNQLDLAVLALPEASFTEGFPIYSDRAWDGMSVFAAGYPGFARTPLWQLSDGIVSNAAVRIDPRYRYLIQHTAPIDAGNSGGPLLVRMAETASGFSVLGVISSKATQRENVGFAIPVTHVTEAIQRAESSIQMDGDPPRLYRELQQEARALALVLASPDPSLDALGRFVSYSAVGERGFETYIATLAATQDNSFLVDSFIRSPVESMRASINMQIWSALKKLGDRSETRFIGVDGTARSVAATRSGVSTRFLVSGSDVDIVWTREYGHWRVEDAILP